jgi:hypothetical protein
MTIEDDFSAAVDKVKEATDRFNAARKKADPALAAYQEDLRRAMQDYNKVSDRMREELEKEDAGGDGNK